MLEKMQIITFRITFGSVYEFYTLLTIVYDGIKADRSINLSLLFKLGFSLKSPKCLLESTRVHTRVGKMGRDEIFRI